MRVKLLNHKTEVTVRPLRENYVYPDCLHRRCIPFREESFTATAEAVWEMAGHPYATVVRDGVRLIAGPSSLEGTDTMERLVRDTEPDYVRTTEDVKKYGVEEFIADAFMMNDNFGIEVHSYTVDGPHCIHADIDLRWRAKSPARSKIKQIRIKTDIILDMYGIGDIKII